MKNFELNVGGIIGAVIAGTISIVVGLSYLKEPNNGRAAGKLIVTGIVGGALLGQLLWGLIFKKDE